MLVLNRVGFWEVSCTPPQQFFWEYPLGITTTLSLTTWEFKCELGRNVLRKTMKMLSVANIEICPVFHAKEISCCSAVQCCSPLAETLIDKPNNGREGDYCSVSQWQE